MAASPALVVFLSSSPLIVVGPDEVLTNQYIPSLVIHISRGSILFFSFPECHYSACRRGQEVNPFLVSLVASSVHIKISPCIAKQCGRRLVRPAHFANPAFAPQVVVGSRPPHQETSRGLGKAPWCAGVWLLRPSTTTIRVPSLPKNLNLVRPFLYSTCVAMTGLCC